MVDYGILRKSINLRDHFFTINFILSHIYRNNTMYKLFTDVNKNFTAEVNIEGASLSDCKARIILESKNVNLLYNGVVRENGLCEVDIGKLKNVLKESDSGNLKLEIIADDTLFTAWETDFIVETKKKVTINEVVDSDYKPKSKSEKSIQIKVNVEEERHTDLNKHIKILEREIQKRNINTPEQFDMLTEKYQSITQKHNNILTEQDIKHIRNHLTSKYFN